MDQSETDRIRPQLNHDVLFFAYQYVFQKTRKEIRKLLRLFDVAPVNRVVLETALEARGFTDFEDAVLHEAARQVGADALVTRNGKDFRRAKLAVYGPEDFISAIVAQQDGLEESD